jgi:multidrug efflux pump subunit AcrA (membrane-fusion protein)
MRCIVFVLSGVCLASSPFSLMAADTAIIPNCTLAPDEEAQIPAQEAGVLTKILVHEGEQVSAKQLLAQIDDVIPRMQREVAYFKFQAASKKSEDDIDIRFAKMAAKVARVDYEESIEANKKVPGTVTHSEVLRRLLDWHKMQLMAEKAEKDQMVAKMEAKMAEAEMHTGDANIERRQIVPPPSWFDRAGKPLDAVVVELTQHVGQWVQIGEPVMRLVRMDRLRVNGVLDAKQYRPSEIQGRAVEITVTLPSLGRQTFSGRVVYVKPVIESNLFQVRAEVENRKQDGVWILNPGMNVEMTIQLK